MGQFGDGTGSAYGTGSLDTPAVLVSGDTITLNLVDDIQSAVIAIETLLAAMPEGVFASVQARLADLASRLTTLETPASSAEGTVVTDTLVNASSGAGTNLLTATSAFPAEVECSSAVVRVTVAFGTSNGLSGLSVGDPEEGHDVWAPQMGITTAPPSVSNRGQHTLRSRIYSLSGRDVILVGLGGNYDPTGQARVTTIARTSTTN